MGKILTAEDLRNPYNLGREGFVYLPTDLDTGSFLKWKDREMVKGVLEELNASGVETYLTGSALHNALYFGKRKYNDIDILGVLNNDNNKDEVLVRKFFGLKGEVREVGGYNFRVYDQKNDLIYLYVGMPIDQRFHLVPKGIVSKILGRNTIDLNLIDKKKFTDGKEVANVSKGVFHPTFFHYGVDKP